ncbi:MAG: thiamine-phosphate pyrophosphorylase [Candidatus Omnitrophica bacterium]|nr:thiamine-phosphate pyrophosphorylase [Candidatus Omnitrophota bacterium]
MVKDSNSKFLRVIDANYNRAKEGLRVCEDVCRFWIDDGKLTKIFKSVRHRLTVSILKLGFKEILAERDVEGDMGRVTIKSEARRKSAADVFYANCQRVKESLRVLEEFAKLRNSATSASIKKLRYEVYSVEKKVLMSMTQCDDS